MIVQSSLFDAGDGLVLERSAGWLQATLFGELALGLCVLAVALFGFALLSGRISIARSWMTVAGCFALIGAPGLAASLVESLGASEFETVAYKAVALPVGRHPLPPVEYSPYAQASVGSQERQTKLGQSMPRPGY